MVNYYTELKIDNTLDLKGINKELSKQESLLEGPTDKESRKSHQDARTHC